jgi:hypothetical protein
MKEETNQLKNIHTAWLLKAAYASIAEGWRGSRSAFEVLLILKPIYLGGGAAEVLMILKLLEPLPPSATRCFSSGDMDECVLAYTNARFSS